MAETVILSAEAEEKLLQPIEEYVGKIQEQIDELRVDGSDRVRQLQKSYCHCKRRQESVKRKKETELLQRIRQNLKRQKR